jgi:hypothetical protein
MIVYKLLHYLMIAEKHFVYIKLRWHCQAIIKPNGGAMRKTLSSFMEKSSADPLLLEWGRRLPAGQAPPEIIYWAPHLAGAWGPVVKAIGKLRAAPAHRVVPLSEEALFQAAAGLSPDRPMSDIYDNFDAVSASWDAELGTSGL